MIQLKRDGSLVTNQNEKEYYCFIKLSFLGAWCQCQWDICCVETCQTWGWLCSQLWNVCKVWCKYKYLNSVLLHKNMLSGWFVNLVFYWRSTGRMRIQSTHSSKVVVHLSGRSSRLLTNCTMIHIIRMILGKRNYFKSGISKKYQII